MWKTFQVAQNVATEWETRLRAIFTKWGESHQTKVLVVSYSGYFTTSVPGRQHCFGCAVGEGVGGRSRRRGEEEDPSAMLLVLRETGISQGCFGERRAERITPNH